MPVVKYTEGLDSRQRARIISKLYFDLWINGTVVKTSIFNLFFVLGISFLHQGCLLGKTQPLSQVIFTTMEKS